MIRFLTITATLIAASLLALASARAEILALVVYETKAEDSVRTLQLGKAPDARRDGLAVIDVDPESETYGRWIADYPLPPGLAGHHLYYNNDLTKIYVTALGKSLLHVVDLTRVPYRIKAVEVPRCKVSENIAFSADGARYYVACLGSNNVLVGDARTDEPITTIDLPKPHPHGIAIHEGIDRILVTSTNSPDFSFIGEDITAIEVSSLKPLKSYKVSNDPSPSKVGPADIVFLPWTDPPVAYIPNWASRTIWAASWDPDKTDFAVQEIFDFGEAEHEFPIASSFNAAHDRMYITTALPGSFHIFDIGDDLLKPVLLKTLPTAPGAHHIAITPDERYAIVQNGLINLPGMNDGSITVIDLEKEEVVGQIDTLKDAGLTHNFILLLPPWHSRTTGR